MARAGIRLVTPDKEIERLIGRDVTEQLNKKLRKNSRLIRTTLASRIRFWIENQPEIQSLKAQGVPNSLASLFGLESGQADLAIDRIINALQDSIQVELTPFNEQYDGGLSFSFRSDNLAAILGFREGHVMTEKGQDLHWLDWLLTKGDMVVIIGYHYNPSDRGRSGGGIMVQKGSFRVPPQFAGTEENNFITRAFDGRESELGSLLRGLLT